MATANVSVLRTGTGFTIDVTACNLSTDTTLKDFIVLVGGAVNSNSNWTKTTPTVLTYVGAALAANTTCEVRRRTPAAPIQVISYAQRFSSGDFNNEIDRITRRAEEYDLNGIGPGSVLTTATPINTAFGPTWDGDTIHPPSADVAYDIISTLAPKDSPVFTGNPTAPTPATADNDTSIATTAYVQANVTPLAPKDSPTFTGNPSAPTPAITDSDTSLATTDFVQNRLRLYVAGNTALTSAAGSGVPFEVGSWNAVSVDRDSAFTVSNGRWVCPTTGYYRVSFSTLVDTGGVTSTSGGAFLYLYNNTDAANVSVKLKVVPAINKVENFSLSRIVRLTAGKTYSLRGFIEYTGTAPKYGALTAPDSFLAIEFVAP